MNNSVYGLAQLIADLHVIVGEAADIPEILEQALPLIEWVSQEPNHLLYARRFESNSESGFGVNLLHEEGDGGLTVCTVAWPPGGYVLPHDHRSWEILSPIHGTVRHSSWRPGKSRNGQGSASIEKCCEFSMYPGQAVAIMPAEIHALENVGPSPSLTLHIYGCNIARIERTRFAIRESGGAADNIP